MRAFVTGASGGIGAATARRLAADGWDLALHAHRHPERAESLAAELAQTGRATFSVTGDLAEPSSATRVAAALRSRWDGLELLVHNAGEYDRRALEKTDDGALDRAINVNLAGPFRWTRALLPMLRSAGTARIVFVSSVLAFAGSRHGAAYATAKAGLVGLARSLALELAPSITVNVVAPGSIETAIIASDTPEVRARRNREIPLGRVGTPEEIAGIIAFLASPGASYVTGATIHANGGWRVD